MLRRSFLPLLPEHAQAAALLSEAADAHVAGDFAHAARCLVRADMPVLTDYTLGIISRINPQIHLQSCAPDRRLMVDKAGQVPMPPTQIQFAVFSRDGWHCRSCGVQVVSFRARQALSRCYAEARWGKRNAERHSGMFALMASLDHALPRGRGGDNSEDNLLTACWPCQFGRMDWTYEEVGFEDPRMRPPVHTGWDGLTRVCNSTVTAKLAV